VKREVSGEAFKLYSFAFEEFAVALGWEIASAMSLFRNIIVGTDAAPRYGFLLLTRSNSLSSSVEKSNEAELDRLLVS